MQNILNTYRVSQEKKHTIYKVDMSKNLNLLEQKAVFYLHVENHFSVSDRVC